ncbi:MAG: Gfo/Idh/MocA family oxidoreductase [Pirellulales bacterium]
MRRNAAKIQEFADQWGYESIETDWKKLIARKDIDAVDICVPNNLHKEIAIAAAQAGKMILCEKPIALNAAEGEEMCAAVEKACVANTVWYNYRRVPAVTMAKQLIDEGRLGKIFITAQTSCKTGPSTKTCPSAGTPSGAWTPRRPARA